MFCVQCCKDSGDVEEIGYGNVADGEADDSHATSLVQAESAFSVPPLKPVDSTGGAPISPGRTDTGRSGAPLTEEQRAEEKKRLQEKVKQFATKTVRERAPCMQVDRAAPGKQPQVKTTPAHYQLDWQLKAFTITPSGMSETRYQFADVEGFYSYEDVDSLELSSVPALTEQERPLAILVHTAKTGEDSWRCLLESSSEKKDEFLTCMRILRLYANAKPGEPPIKTA